MNVLFAPDYREGNPYQTYLANALTRTGECSVRFAKGYRRLLPITRLCRTEKPDLLHLHWPEAYCPTFGRLASLRPWRLPLDIALTTHVTPFVVTAHNLWPHHHPKSFALNRGLSSVYRQARVVIAHSAEAAQQVAAQWNLPDRRIVVIPHGNFAPKHFTAPKEPVAPYALNFGTIAPYKGIEDLIEWWRRNRPPLPLRIVGIVNLPEYPPVLERLIDGDEIIQFTPGRVSDEELVSLITNARVVVINHTAGLTSSVASLSRSLSVNQLIPRRMAAVDLMEPHPSVFRFDNLKTDFATQLSAALQTPRQPRDEQWWRTTSWESVADATLCCYRTALSA